MYQATVVQSVLIYQLVASEIGKMPLASYFSSVEFSVLGSHCQPCSSSGSRVRKLTLLIGQINMSICLNELDQIITES